MAPNASRSVPTDYAQPAGDALERIQPADSAVVAFAFESRAASAGLARLEVLGIVRRAKALRSSGCESRPATIVPAVMLSW